MESRKAHFAKAGDSKRIQSETCSARKASITLAIAFALEMTAARRSRWRHSDAPQWDSSAGRVLGVAEAFCIGTRLILQAGAGPCFRREARSLVGEGDRATPFALRSAFVALR
jgi:hypothetical protein